MNFFNPQIVVLAITGVINLAMSIFVFSRGIKNRVNLYFGLLTFLAFMWALTQLFAILTIDLSWLFFLDRSTYLFGLAIMICLLYFIIYFPYKSGTLTIFEKILIWVPAGCMAVIIYTKFFISNYLMIGAQKYEYYFYGSALIVYMLYFLMIALMALLRLWKKYQNATIIFKNQIGGLFIIFFVCLAFGFYIDLFLPYFKNFYFIWMAPLPTLIMNGVVFFFVISPKEKIND